MVVAGRGDDLHRRSLYTDTRRSTPYPSFATFDAPNRETCTLRRGRSNTPLQAFVTLNDPVFVEASQGLARRLLKEGPADTTARLQLAFRLCVARAADAHEHGADQGQQQRHRGPPCPLRAVGARRGVAIDEYQ